VVGKREVGGEREEKEVKKEGIKVFPLLKGT